MKIHVIVSYECQRELELEVDDNATVDEIKDIVSHQNFHIQELSPPECITVSIFDENMDEIASID